MYSILMCKNTEVYNIDTEQVINKDLLPGYILKCPCYETFKSWLKLRYSTNSNALARKLKGVTFGQGNRVKIDRETHALSLSDCYWIKDDEDTILFEDISPYYNDFWKGNGLYSGGAIPTLYVGGAMTKEWVSACELRKYSPDSYIELLCIKLCEACSVPCNTAYHTGNGIAVINITNPNIMLEQVDASGRLNEDDFTDEDIVDLFGLRGFQVLVIDAIVGNGDRHLGNLAFLRDPNTGDYISMSPVYDFDHVLDSELDCDRLITDMLDIAKSNKSYSEEAERIASIAVKQELHPVFTKRANTILNSLDNFLQTAPC